MSDKPKSPQDAAVDHAIRRFAREMDRLHANYAIAVMTKERIAEGAQSITAGNGERECILALFAEATCQLAHETHDEFHRIAEELDEEERAKKASAPS